MTRGIERTFPRPFSETFRISKNEDFNVPYLENENEFLKNSFETVFRASKSCDRGQLILAFQLTFKYLLIYWDSPETNIGETRRRQVFSRDDQRFVGFCFNISHVCQDFKIVFFPQLIRVRIETCDVDLLTFESKADVKQLAENSDSALMIPPLLLFQYLKINILSHS